MDRLAIGIMLAFVLPCLRAADVYSPSVLPANFEGELPPYAIRAGRPGVSANLFGYIGCKDFSDPLAKAKIDQAYYDAFLMSRAPGIADIDWNSAAALDYLGAPGFNFDKQPEIQAVLANAAAIIFTPEAVPPHFIKVRCDDPGRLCQRSPAKDSCTPSQTDSTPPGTRQTPAAYASPQDPDQPDYPMINFCEDFFNAFSLQTAIEYATSAGYPGKLNMAYYVNRAHLIFHEILHLWENASFPRPRDVQIDVRLGLAANLTTATAYGPSRAKILARWPGGPLIGGTGYWVQRNADNLALYALAQYLTYLNEDLYPSYPLVVYQNARAPHLPSNYRQLVTQFSHVNDSLVLGAPGDRDELEPELFDGGQDTCFNFGAFDDGTSSDLAVTIDDLVPNSAYPDEYHQKVSALIDTLADHIAATEPSSGSDPAGSSSQSTFAEKPTSSSTKPTPSKKPRPFEKHTSSKKHTSKKHTYSKKPTASKKPKPAEKPTALSFP